MIKKATGKIGIIGAGPGGLTSAMLLQSKGFDVTVFERASDVGGRNGSLQVGSSKFDIGPTMLMMKFVLDKCFQDAGRDVDKYLKFYRLNPMYRLHFDPERHIDIYDYSMKDKMLSELGRVFPNDQHGYDKFIEWETRRYKYTIPLLEKAYRHHGDLVSWDSIKALPYLTLGQSLYGILGKFYNDPLLKLSFSFQAKYLGMSPWDCPAFFGLIPYVEHAFGVYHVEGGMSEISQAMAKVFKEYGGTIRLNTPVKQLVMKGKTVKSILLESGEEFAVDDVVVNADFGYVVSKLIPDSDKLLKKWAPQNLDKKKFSCSTFMMYLSLNKFYPLQHNVISFAEDYDANMKNIASGKMTEDFSCYIRNASINDPTLSPPGKCGLYVLVPVPNLIKDKEFDWSDESQVQYMRELTLQHLERRLGLHDIRENIEAEQIITPRMWHDERNVHQGAVFSLAHGIFQLLTFRPRNKFEELDNVYIAGAGTHPGSGLPTIYESARITTDFLCQKYGIKYDRGSYLV
jgi:phytoene desaturase